jgi:hypothetical protein
MTIKAYGKLPGSESAHQTYSEGEIVDKEDCGDDHDVLDLVGEDVDADVDAFFGISDV